MGIIDVPPELLFSIVDDLSLVDLLSLRSTCCRVRDVLNQRFQKICLQDVGQLTAIQWAAVHGYAELIELAILNGAMIDAPLQGILKWNKIGKAKSVNRIKICDILDWANRSAEGEAKDLLIRTPLFLAACFGQMKAIKVLLKQHASMQCFGKMMTPAHISAARGDIDCVQEFIQAGFNINTRGTRNQTILHVATLRGLKMMNYILQLEGGVNLVNTQDNNGFTPLSYIATGFEHCNRRTREMVRLLLRHGANIHTSDNSGDMAAHYFAWMGLVGCLQLLIDAGFDLQSRGAHGKTILHCAVVGGEKVTQYLLGLDGVKMIIDIENNHGKTPLQFALEMSHKWPVVKALMRHGATCTSR